MQGNFNVNGPQAPQDGAQDGFRQAQVLQRCGRETCVGCNESLFYACSGLCSSATPCPSLHVCKTCQCGIRRYFTQLSDDELTRFGTVGNFQCPHRDRATLLRCRECCLERISFCVHSPLLRQTCSACGDALRKEVNYRRRRDKALERELKQRQMTLTERAARVIACDPLLLLSAVMSPLFDQRMWHIVCDQVPSHLTPNYRRQLEECVRQHDCDNMFYTLGKVFSRFYPVGDGRECVSLEYMPYD